MCEDEGIRPCSDLEVIEKILKGCWLYFKLDRELPEQMSCDPTSGGCVVSRMLGGGVTQGHQSGADCNELRGSEHGHSERAEPSPSADVLKKGNCLL